MYMYQLVIASVFAGVSAVLALAAWYNGWTRVGLAAGGFAFVGLLLVTLLAQMDSPDA
mgnify:CR=1 FL=1